MGTVKVGTFTGCEFSRLGNIAMLGIFQCRNCTELNFSRVGVCVGGRGGRKCESDYW